MSEHLIRLKKLKKLFKIKGKNKIVEHRIKAFMDENIKRIEHKEITNFIDTHHKILDDILYKLEVYAVMYKHLTAFKLYKIFKLCLYSLNELRYFEIKIGTIKEYDYQKQQAIVDKAKKFIINADEIKVKIPKNPNDTYNDIYTELLCVYTLNREDVLSILKIIYLKDKKAKLPTSTVKQRKKIKKDLTRLIQISLKNKKMTKQEAKEFTNKLNNL